MDHLKTKDIIMGKVKQALSSPTNVSVALPDQDSPIYEALGDDLEMAFAERFLAVKGQFFFCVDHQELIEQIEKFAAVRQVKNLFVWEKELLAQLDKSTIRFNASEEQFINCEVGITTCEALVARTGSILVSSKSLSGRRLSVFPPIHIVVAYTSQIVAEIKDGFSLLKDKYSASTMPSMISLVTGPSRTADIEKTLVLGAHGPRELILFLIDDSSN
jgi:L-lactate dehydrogenase complex protein LldG